MCSSAYGVRGNRKCLRDPEAAALQSLCVCTGFSCDDKITRFPIPGAADLGQIKTGRPHVCTYTRTRLSPRTHVLLSSPQSRVLVFIQRGRTTNNTTVQSMVITARACTRRSSKAFGRSNRALLHVHRNNNAMGSLILEHSN